ncbi:MAG: sigma-54-dependent Fis family transcriptional regulator, partial [Desulfomonilia bacterium]
ENLIERELIRRRGFENAGSLVFEYLGLPELREKKSDVSEDAQARVSLDEVISQYIRKTLIQTKGKIFGPGGAAEFMKVNPNTLRSRMRKLGLPMPKKDTIY